MLKMQVDMDRGKDYNHYMQQNRKSVGWINFPGAQTDKILKNSLYTVAAEKDNQVVSMGKLIGDGMYYMIVDIVVQPACQRMGIGSKVLRMMVEYVDKETPVGGRLSIICHSFRNLTFYAAIRR